MIQANQTLNREDPSVESLLLLVLFLCNIGERPNYVLTDIIRSTFLH